MSVMGGKTLTRADLAEAVVRKVGLPRNESQDLVELILSEISISLAMGDQVKLSSFGSFGIRQKGERVGRNPKTGKEVPITPRRVLVFRPSNVMKERINAGAKRKSAAVKVTGKAAAAKGVGKVGKASGKDPVAKAAVARAPRKTPATRQV
jgi:integration host factor subunit alpha